MEEIKLIKSTFYKEKDTKKKLINFLNSAKQLSFGLECEGLERYRIILILK